MTTAQQRRLRQTPARAEDPLCARKRENSHGTDHRESQRLRPVPHYYHAGDGRVHGHGQLQRLRRQRKRHHGPSFADEENYTNWVNATKEINKEQQEAKKLDRDPDVGERLSMRFGQGRARTNHGRSRGD
jgi:hypothetical protein